MPLDFSDPRYDGRPLLRFLDAYALAVIGALSAEDERIVAPVVNRGPGTTENWRNAVRRSAGLPDDFDDKILELWRRQPPGVNPAKFVLAVSDANFVRYIDPVGIVEDKNDSRG